MKKVLLIGSLLISSVAFADVDLDSGLGTDLGYSGFEFSVAATNISSKNKNFISEKYLMIEKDYLNTLSFLQRDNRDRDKILNLQFENINGNFTTHKNLSVLLGYSDDLDSRIGMKFTYSFDKLKDNSNKGNGYSGQLFYHLLQDESAFTAITYIHSNDYKEGYKSLDYGIMANYEHQIPNLYFDYIEPSYYINGNVVRIDNKVKNEKDLKNTSLSTTAGLKAKNEIEFDDVTITTIGKVGLEHEFLGKQKYKDTNVSKNSDKDNIVVGLDFDVKFTEVLDVYANVNLKKSLNGGYSNSSTIGFKISL
ncbi:MULTISPECIES: autotransporter domain-containing protein [unclassified Fusobacterium]|uniref:autotransporter domain-containing protein n=1 Tax=unclassified Fusobacterium TaxID=2648384 RepID=UPI001B8D77FB|nr:MULTISPECIES: autotransporter domain-containing protein [unclassified Fusobacterium]